MYLYENILSKYIVYHTISVHQKVISIKKQAKKRLYKEKLTVSQSSLQQLLVVVLCCIQSCWLWGQQDTSQLQRPISNWRVVELAVQDTLVLDSLPVFPNSLTITANNQHIPDSTYVVQHNQLIFVNRPAVSTIKLRFRVFPYALGKERQHKDVSAIGKELAHDGLIGGAYTYNPFTKGTDAFKFSDLDYSGVFARGIALGNNQDLTLNSTFNLNVSGKLGDIEILGAISDNNVPLQPEGNTQQLSELDRIFVQFSYKKQRLIAGDYDLKRPKGSYFMNYYRRLQGGHLSTDLKLGKKGRLKTDVSFAVSKGKFARNIFDGEEGNQGPYRLKGANGELFIIIVGGTERVYIDGKLLKRGTDNDYIIDYNLGEITFTNRQLITKDKRIQVEFTYTDLTFLRTLATANTAYETKNTTVRFNFYSEQDAKGQTVAETLSDEAKAVLTEVGDDIGNAFISGIRPVADQENENLGLIFYKLVDTTVAGVPYDSVLIFTNNPDSGLYTAKFSIVTTGGDYIRDASAANGVVYRWVAPDPLTGLAKGTHAPIQLLVTPKQRQLYTFGAEQKLGKNGVVMADVALSNVDQNTFSDVGNEDNQGVATRLTYRHKIPLFIGKTVVDSTQKDSSARKASHYLSIQTHYEYLMKEFEFVEPYRTREFSRDWNINLPEKTQEHLYYARLTFGGHRWGNLVYEFSGLNKDSLYNGFRHTLSARVKSKGLLITTNNSLVQNQTMTERGLFIRPKLDVSYSFKKLNNWKIGVYGEMERNQRMNLATDTLTSTSFFYNLFKVYTELPVIKGINLRAHYIRRYDYSPVQSDFLTNAIADDFNVGGAWKASEISRLKWDFTYRNLSVLDTLLTTQEPKETYLGRLEYVLRTKDRFITANTVYQIGSGQQQRVQYNYVNVNQGQGTHIWVDRNNDEVQQINEFELAQFADQADYIRVTLLTGEFIRTNNVSFSQSLNISPARLIAKIRKKRPAWKKELPRGIDFIKRFYTKSSYRIERKTFDGAEGVVAFNPFQTNIADTALVSTRASLQNSLFFNRSGKYSFEFRQIDNRSRTFLTTGFETRSLSEYAINQSLRFRPGKQKTGKKFSKALRNITLKADVKASYGELSNVSEFFPDRDYKLDVYKLEPSFTFNFKQLFRATLKYKFKYKENKIGLLDLARSHDVTTELKYSKGSKTVITASFSIVELEYDGDPTSPVGYAITEGLQGGSNYLWNVSFTQSLSRNIQMTLSYEGRKTGDTAPVVHVGRAEIRANF